MIYSTSEVLLPRCQSVGPVVNTKWWSAVRGATLYVLSWSFSGYVRWWAQFCLPWDSSAHCNEGRCRLDSKQRRFWGLTDSLASVFLVSPLSFGWQSTSVPTDTLDTLNDENASCHYTHQNSSIKIAYSWSTALSSLDLSLHHLSSLHQTKGTKQIPQASLQVIIDLYADVGQWWLPYCPYQCLKIELKWNLEQIENGLGYCSRWVISYDDTFWGISTQPESHGTGSLWEYNTTPARL